MAVDLRAAHFLSVEAARALHEAGRPGSIIHASSRMGRVGGPERSVCCATKHGLEGMVKAMAIEWGGIGIRINTVCPTFIRTPPGEQTLADPDKRVDREQDQARPRGRGRRGDGRGRLPHLRRRGARYRLGADDRRRVDGGVMSEKVSAGHVAGVSRSAVSRVFTPRASVSKATAEKVRKAAAELGYRPNVLARSLMTGRSRIIGLVVAHLENYFSPEALDKLRAARRPGGETCRPTCSTGPSR